MKLVIVESPAKCKKIESFLGSEYKCIASFGHITQLNKLEYIDFDNYENNKYQYIKSKNNQISTIKKMVSKAETLYIATDNDREGEAIGYHICKLCNLNPYSIKRIIFQEITKPAIVNAINNPTYLNKSIIDAQQTRQILDLCVGFKISPILWKCVANKLSAGRCQTPALNIIKENEDLVVSQFAQGVTKFKTTGYFDPGFFQGMLNHDYETKEDILNFINLCKTYKFFCNVSDIQIDKNYPPKPFITSTIQQTSYNLFKFPPKKTMSCCQKLYEAGYITYMRTDSTVMSVQFINNAINYIEIKYGKNFVSSSYGALLKNKNKSKSQDAHECIRCTDINKSPDCFSNIKHNLTPDCIKIYQLIYKQTIKSLMSQSIYDKIILTIDAPDDKQFVSSVKQMKFEGFEIIDQNYKDKMNNKDFNHFYTFKGQNINVQYKNIFSKEYICLSRNLYNESSMVKILEQKNIGRPSTFSTILSTIEDKNYVSKEKNIILGQINLNTIELENNSEIKIEENETTIEQTNKYKLTELGRRVLDICYKYFNDLFNYNFTEEMELNLDNICLGKTKKKDICNQYNELLNNLLKDVDIQKETKIKKELNQKFKKKNLGKYQNNAIYQSFGRYGYYLTWKKINVSLNDKIEDNNFSEEFILDLDSAINFIEEKIQTNKQNIIKEFNNDISIRTGQYGEYIYYKTTKMKNPKFISLSKFNNDYNTCDIETIQTYINENMNKPKKNFRYKNKYKK